MIKSDSETWTPRIKEMGFQPIEGSSLRSSDLHFLSSLSRAE